MNDHGSQQARRVLPIGKTEREMLCLIEMQRDVAAIIDVSARELRILQHRGKNLFRHRTCDRRHRRDEAIGCKRCDRIVHAARHLASKQASRRIGGFAQQRQLIAEFVQQTGEAPRSRAAQQGGGNPLESLSLDIGRLMDRNLAAEMWDRYQRGESKAFTKRLYTAAGQKAFDEVARKYRGDRNFKQTVDRYITEFERLLDEVARDERGPAVLRGHLTSETGLVYTLLAHAAGRLG